jgi:hypothetical protein
MLLNFDMTATAFVEEGHVLTFACNVLRLRPEQFSGQCWRATFCFCFCFCFRAAAAL